MIRVSWKMAAEVVAYCSACAGRLHALALVAFSIGGANTFAADLRNVVPPIEHGGLPLRVHVFEDYETDIEKRWWMRGQAVEDEVPRSHSASVENRRACRASETKDFDDKMGDPSVTYKAVIFNPVPGPPMGERTRLSFRYRLSGSDTLRVQIYSLTNGYHRHLSLTGLKQEEWQDATVDMTQARRPDGSGGPLAADERIDDIQFYINREADLWIDDIVLFEANAARVDSQLASGCAGGTRPQAATQSEEFPRRIIFTGWFDTGKQGVGNEWPGRFEIVKHEPPLTWKAARSVRDEETGAARIEVSMRGARRLSAQTRLQFRYRLSGGDAVNLALVDSKSKREWKKQVAQPRVGEWSNAVVDFNMDSATRTATPQAADKIHFEVLQRDAVLLVDDALLYEPGSAVEK
jgi:hypothetical protein